MPQINIVGREGVIDRKYCPWVSRKCLFRNPCLFVQSAFYIEQRLDIHCYDNRATYSITSDYIAYPDHMIGYNENSSTIPLLFQVKLGAKPNKLLL